MVCAVFLVPGATTLSSVICGFVLLAGQSASHPTLIPPGCFSFIFLVCLLLKQRVTAEGQVGEGRGEARKDAFSKTSLLFYFYRSNLQVNIHSLHGIGVAFPFLLVLDSAMILFIVHKAKTPCNDLYSLQVMHTKRGVLSQREASLMKHSCGDLAQMTPCCYICAPLEHTWPCWKSKLTSPLGAMPPGRVSGCSLLLLVSCAAVTNYH